MSKAKRENRRIERALNGLAHLWSEARDAARYCERHAVSADAFNAMTAEEKLGKIVEIEIFLADEISHLKMLVREMPKMYGPWRQR